jgi:capsular polysaccharide biosynthesis protein
MEYQFNSRESWRILMKWKKHLLIIVLVTAALAAFFSGPRFITPLYRSYAVVYPDNLKLYSKESSTEQMMQVLNSRDITDSVIQKFDLLKHYRIDTNYKYYRTELLQKFHEKVTIAKTSYEAVKVEVLDENPDTAKLMADAILHYYNLKMQRMQKGKFRELANAYAGQLKREKFVMDSIKNRLRILGTQKGIFEYTYQSQQIMMAYLHNIQGSPSAVNTKEAKRLAKNMGQYGGELVQLVNMLQHEAAAYVQVKLSYEAEYRHVVSKVTYTNVVTHPFVSDKKAYPVRWLIVLVAVLSVFTLSLIVISFVENGRKSQVKE